MKAVISIQVHRRLIHDTDYPIIPHHLHIHIAGIFLELTLFNELNILYYRKETERVTLAFVNLEIGKAKLKLYLNTSVIFLHNFQEDPKVRKEAGLECLNMILLHF